MAVLVNNNRLYADVKRSFDEHPATSDVVATVNEDAVKEAVINLCFTRPGERRMKPNIGAGLAALMFDPISVQTADVIKDVIINTITSYEPRVKLIEVTVTASPDENKYDATIVFSVINISTVVTITRVLERVR
jgi:phage baseplate assembly protein W